MPAIRGPLTRTQRRRNEQGSVTDDVLEESNEAARLQMCSRRTPLESRARAPLRSAYAQVLPDRGAESVDSHQNAARRVERARTGCSPSSLREGSAALSHRTPFCPRCCPVRVGIDRSETIAWAVRENGSASVSRKRRVFRSAGPGVDLGSTASVRRGRFL